MAHVKVIQYLETKTIVKKLRNPACLWLCRFYLWLKWMQMNACGKCIGGKKEKALGELGLCMWCAGIPLILDILDQSCWCSTWRSGWAGKYHIPSRAHGGKSWETKAAIWSYSNVNPPHRHTGKYCSCVRHSSYQMFGILRFTFRKWCGIKMALMWNFWTA